MLRRFFAAGLILRHCHHSVLHPHVPRTCQPLLYSIGSVSCTLRKCQTLEDAAGWAFEVSSASCKHQLGIAREAADSAYQQLSAPDAEIIRAACQAATKRPAQRLRCSSQTDAGAYRPVGQHAIVAI